MNKVKYSLGILLLFLTFGVTAQAQRANPTPDPILQSLEEAVDKIKRLEIENTSLKAQMSIKDEKLSLKDEQISNKEEQVQFYKKAYENGTKIDTNASLIIENLRVQVNDYRVELLDLRNENDKLRGSRTTRTLIGFGAGLGLGYWANSK